MRLRFQSAVFFTTDEPQIPICHLSTTVLHEAITCLTGCSTTGMDRSVKTTNSMQKVAGDYRYASNHIDTTRAVLEAS